VFRNALRSEQAAFRRLAVVFLEAHQPHAFWMIGNPPNAAPGIAEPINAALASIARSLLAIATLMHQQAVIDSVGPE
jgi:hypothetical protein